MDKQNLEALRGRRVRYTGDVANAPREATITKVWEDRWGQQVEMTFDEPKALGWERDGTAIRFRSEVESLHAHLLVEADSAKPGDRFRLLPPSKG